MLQTATTYVAAALAVVLLIVGLIAWHQHGTIVRQRDALVQTSAAVDAAVAANATAASTLAAVRDKLGACTAEIEASAEAQAKALREREQRYREAEERAADLRRRNSLLTAALDARCRAWATEPVCVDVEAIP